MRALTLTEVANHEGAEVVRRIGELTRRVHVGGNWRDVEKPDGDWAVPVLAPVSVLVAEWDGDTFGDEVPGGG